MSYRPVPGEEELQKIAEFDHPFRVNEDGTVSDAYARVDGREFHYSAPTVFNDPDNDVEIDGAQWEALTGHTGQHLYNGAVMHSSEFLGGGLATYVLSHPGVYVVVVCNVYPDELEPEDPTPAGWCLMRLRDCESTISDNHSEDRVTVYSGNTTPRVLCGYHNMRESK